MLALTWRPTDSENWKLATLAVDGSQFREVYAAAGTGPPYALAWTSDGRGLLFAPNGDQCRLLRRTLDAGAPEFTGLEFPNQRMAGPGCDAVSVSPDGRQVAYQGAQPAQEIWAIDVSAAALAKRAR